MPTEPRTTPESRAALRRRYSAEKLVSPRCRQCGEEILRVGEDDAGWPRWKCTWCGTSYGLTDPGDPDVLAALDDADALAGALAEAVRLKGALDVAEKALMLYADVHLYESFGDEQSRADDDEGAKAAKTIDTIWEMCPERRWPERRWPESRGEDWRLAVRRVLRYHQEEAVLLARILGFGPTPGDREGQTDAC